MSESNNKNPNTQPSGKEDSNKRATSERIESLRNPENQQSHTNKAKPSNTSTNFNDDGTTEQSKNSTKEVGKDKASPARAT